MYSKSKFDQSSNTVCAHNFNVCQLLGVFVSCFRLHMSHIFQDVLFITLGWYGVALNCSRQHQYIFKQYKENQEKVGSFSEDASIEVLILMICDKHSFASTFGLYPAC